MRLRVAVPLVLAVLLFTGLAASGAAQDGLAVFERDSLVIRTANGAEHGFEIELALSAPQQAQGLMYRPSLAAEAGMLFVYRPARSVRMWMRNTAIPLDMLFVSENGKIVKIVERTVPFSLAIIASDRPVRGVIEVNGGTAARLGLRPGDQVLHPAFDPEG